MAQGFYGADPEQLRALAKQFSSGSNQIRSSLETVSSLVNSTQSWQGPDASAFQQRWNSQVKQLGNTVVHALELGSTTLIKNADEQTATSQVDGGAGGPGGSGPGSHGGPGGSGSGTSPWEAFRGGWKAWGDVKLFPGLVKNLYGLDVMWQQGWQMFKNPEAWKDLKDWNKPYNLMNKATDVLGLNNLNKYIPALDSAKGFFGDEVLKPFQGKGSILESLGKGGLGRGLGWAGVGLGVFDTVNYANEGKVGDAVWSGVKTGLGVACFLPPPAGTVAQVASAAIAIYEIPVVKDFVNGTVANAVEGGGKLLDLAGKGAEAAGKEVNKFANDVNKNIKDMGKGVADFLGW